MAGGRVQVVHARRARVGGAMLVAEEDGDEGQVRPEGVFEHVHREALQAATQRVKRCAALVALDLGAAALLAHRADETPAIPGDALHALYRLHGVRVDHPKLRDPLHSMLPTVTGVPRARNCSTAGALLPRFCLDRTPAWAGPPRCLSTALPVAAAVRSCSNACKEMRWAGWWRAAAGSRGRTCMHATWHQTPGRVVGLSAPPSTGHTAQCGRGCPSSTASHALHTHLSSICGSSRTP